MASITQLELEGKSPSAVYAELVEGGIRPNDAAVLVGSWIFENFGKAKRTFNYSEAFAETDANCAVQFNRSLQHQDWVDGESVVQAQQTPGEEGFNLRFHQIENDLDAIRGDLTRAFTCMAGMRASVNHLLSEIRTEINRINNDVFQCCNAAPPTGPTFPGNFPPLLEMPNFLGVTKFGEKNVSLWRTDRGIFILPTVETIGPEVIGDDRVTRPGIAARLIAENPAINESFPQAFAKKELIRKFGTVATAEGRQLQDLLRILPEDARYPSLDAMINDLADREAAALRTTTGVEPAVAAVFGLETPKETVATASLERFATIPAAARAALLRRGVDTVQALAQTEPKKIAEILQAEGIQNLGGADAAEWTATAKVLTGVR